jgi:hypothetical protein
MVLPLCKKGYADHVAKLFACLRDFCFCMEFPNPSNQFMILVVMQGVL